MTRKAIQVLVAITIALVLLLFVLDRDVGDVSSERTVLLEGFRAVANDAQSIDLKRSDGEDDVTIRREDSGWIVSARDGCPADVSKLGRLITALADASVVEEKTSNPANYEKLGVADPAEGGSGVLVEVTGTGFSFSVILGEAAQGNYRYARIPDQATSYLVDQNPSIPDSAAAWLSPGLVDIPASRVRNVTITHADGETIVIEKTDEEQTDFVVRDVPEGRELSYATVGNGIAGALDGLTFDDVRALVTEPPTTTAVFETWDGLRVSAEVVTKDDLNWVAFAADLVNEESAAADEAAEINARVSGWQYRLADFKKNLLMRRWDDILKSADAD